VTLILVMYPNSRDKKASALPRPSLLSPELITNLPMLQILGELHPFKRLLTIPHLDERTIASLADAVLLVFRLPLDTRSRQTINALVRTHETVFKSLVTNKDGGSARELKKDFINLGGGPLGVLLSIAIPLILAQLNTV